MLENPRELILVAQWEEKQARMEAVWALRQQGRITAEDGVSLAYAWIEPEQRRERAVVIAPGRTEFIDKYIELAFDFYQQGYAVYVVDHRGQGFSDRLLADPHKGHVGSFDDYVQDLRQFLLEVVEPRESALPLLLGHSMGGAIVTRFLQLYPGEAAAGLLCAPMFEINTGAPQSIVWPILSRVDALLASDDKEPAYVPGGIPYEEVLYRKEGRLNNLTSCEQRLDYFNRQYVNTPEVQLGSPTRHWLLRAFEVMAQLLADADKLCEPLAVLVSTDDRIVRSRGTTAFIEAAQRGPGRVESLYVAGAQHELLMEADEFRVPALGFLLDFADSLDSDRGN